MNNMTNSTNLQIVLSMGRNREGDVGQNLAKILKHREKYFLFLNFLHTGLSGRYLNETASNLTSGGLDLLIRVSGFS